MRGYFGVAIYHPKIEANIGGLWRSASLFGASQLATIGRRYRKQASDRRKAYRHIPLMHYRDIEQFVECGIPYACQLIGVELSPTAIPLRKFSHPQRAIYLLGAEDHGLPEAVLERCHALVQVEQTDPVGCLNVATAGSLVMYDRMVRCNQT